MHNVMGTGAGLSAYSLLALHVPLPHRGGGGLAVSGPRHAQRNTNRNRRASALHMLLPPRAVVAVATRGRPLMHFLTRHSHDLATPREAEHPLMHTASSYTCSCHPAGARHLSWSSRKA